MAKELSGEARSILSWELARLYRAGLNWSDSVALLSRQDNPPELAATLSALAEALSTGVPASEAFAATGRFPVEYVRQLEVGQTAGRMEQVLEALAAYDRRESETRAALRQAVTYPLTMIALIAAIFFFLGWKVLPVFNSVFAQLGAVGTGEGGRLWLMAGALVCGALALGLLVWFRSGRGLPLFERGRVGLLEARARFASALAMMLQSGIPLDESFHRCGELLKGGPLAQPVAACEAAMGQGREFAQAVAEAGVLDQFHSGLLAAGFRAGGLTEALEEIAGRCTRQARERLSANLNRFEYALVLFLCAAVAAMLLAVMLPLAGMLSALGG